jgi:hypothetical protein
VPLASRVSAREPTRRARLCSRISEPGECAFACSDPKGRTLGPLPVPLPGSRSGLPLPAGGAELHVAGWPARTAIAL